MSPFPNHSSNLYSTWCVSCLRLLLRSTTHGSHEIHMPYNTQASPAQLGGTLGALAYKSYSSEKLISFSAHSWRETRGTGGDLVWPARQPCTFWLRDIKIEKYSAIPVHREAVSPSAAHTQSVVLFSGDVSSGHYPMGRQASLELAAWLGKLRIPSHERGQPTGSPSQEGGELGSAGLLGAPAAAH